MGFSAAGMSPLGERERRGNEEQKGRETDILHNTEPWVFLDFYDQLLKGFQQSGEPDRVKATDMADILGGNLLASFTEDAGRRNLPGGFMQQGRNSIRGGTAANKNSIILQFYMDAMKRAQDQAGSLLSNRVAGLTRTPLIPKSGKVAGSLPTSFSVGPVGGSGSTGPGGAGVPV